ncbi:MAG TPA: hypothetical protein VEB86_07285 [Chryseosolibacter sp.]|nr:hypothetical protein [Chryseosolibacter sp.]
MQKTLLILGGIGLVCSLLVARLFFRQRDRFESEREWFAKALRYEFSARVDSIRMFNKHTGRLWCRITAGDPQTHREDSLKRYFKEHDMLYLIFVHSGDSIIFIAPNGNDVAQGDSVRVSSEKNTIQFFRDGILVATGKLSETLTGFGRPFFLKSRDR